MLLEQRLNHLLFPLGNYLKSEVRELARQKGLPAADRPSSQDICFTSTGCATFLSQRSTATQGEIINRRGEVLGKHKGMPFYTVGQRHGLGLAAAERLYVTNLEPDTNRITVGTEEELCSSSLTASRVNWVSGKPPSEPITVNAKIRYRSPEVAATLSPKSDSADIEFHRPQRAIAPGQAIVFYQDSKVLGGGTIEN